MVLPCKDSSVKLSRGSQHLWVMAICFSHHWKLSCQFTSSVWPVCLPIRFEFEGLGHLRFSRPNASDISTRVFFDFLADLAPTAAAFLGRQRLLCGGRDIFLSALGDFFHLCQVCWNKSTSAGSFEEISKERKKISRPQCNYSICNIGALCVTIFCSFETN